jgi:hypothetical protein
MMACDVYGSVNHMDNLHLLNLFSHLLKNTTVFWNVMLRNML